MSEEQWRDHLARRVAELTREVQRLRTKVRYEHLRAEAWKNRALRKTVRR